MPEAAASIPAIGRLPGIDGNAKMSKSLGNAIPLSATPNEIRNAVRQIFTDPGHLRAADPGQVEGNMVFIYLDAFGDDHTLIEDLKARYRRGGLGDMVVTRQLEEVLQTLLAPIRERSVRYSRDPDYVMGVL